MRKLSHEEITRDRLAPDQLVDAERPPLYGFLDSVRSLYNVGSMFRTSDGGRIAGLFLAGFTPFPPRPEIEKTALGATRTVPWWYYRDPLEGIAAVRARGARICVLEHTSDGRPYTSIRPKEFPICLVVGNEIRGVSPAVLSAADCAIEIPMYGTKQSLNAAVAYGIALFELLRIWYDHSGISQASVK